MMDFIKQRLADMHRHPAMWAWTREAFGMQVLLLAEVACAAGALREDRRGLDHLKIEVLGHDTSRLAERLVDDWARMAVEIVRGFLLEYAT